MVVALQQPVGLPEKYSIALSRPEDLKAIPAIEVAAAATFAEADLPLGIRYRVTDQDVLEVARREGRLWIALNGDNGVVGFAMLEVVDGMAHLDELDVHPDHARQGIGSSLLRVAIDWAVREGYPVMTLVTFRHLAWNAPYFQKFGFSEIQQDDLGLELSEMLRDETAVGLSKTNRIAMRLKLDKGTSDLFRTK